MRGKEADLEESEENRRKSESAKKDLETRRQKKIVRITKTREKTTEDFNANKTDKKIRRRNCPKRYSTGNRKEIHQTFT